MIKKRVQHNAVSVLNYSIFKVLITYCTCMVMLSTKKQKQKRILNTILILNFISNGYEEAFIKDSSISMMLSKKDIYSL